MTLVTPPQAGNRLVVLATNALTDPATWIWSHGLTLDATSASYGGWRDGIASGIVTAGASATVTVAGLNASYGPALCVWELSPCGFVEASWDGHSSSLAVATLPTTKPGLALAGILTGSNRTFALGSGTVDFSDLRHQFSHAVTDGALIQTITLSTSNAAAALLGNYAAGA